MSPTDAELLDRIAGGDRDALAELYDRYAPRIFGLLVRIVRNPTDAEDVLQTIFWQIWCRAGQFTPERSRPDVWLLLMARSRALDHCRQQSRRNAGESTPGPTRSVADDPADAAERGEVADRVRAALERLPSEQSRAIRAAFFDGLLYDDIARRDGIPVGTVKSRVKRGMDRLRELLSECDRPKGLS